jgi:hypothetical protein
MADHRHALSVNKSDSADAHIATVLEGRFVGNRGKQTYSGVVEKSRVPEMSSVIPVRILKVDTSNIFFNIRRAVR